MLISAAIVREKGTFVLEEAELDAPRPDEILIRLKAVGMCHTDLAVRDQHVPLPLPVVLGHEGAGVVEQVGSRVTAFVPGDHVVLSYGSCGQCAKCTEGRPYNCERFIACNASGCRLDGTSTIHQHGTALTASFFSQSSFATYALATERNAVKVPRDLPLELLAPLGCGIQTGAGAVLNALKPKRGSAIAIFGTGAVGLSAVMAAAVADCGVIIAVDVSDERLALARELGATHGVNANAADAVAEIMQITGTGADNAVEATGVPRVMEQAFAGLSSTGTLIVLGVAPFGATLTIAASDILNGKTIRGAIEGESVPDRFLPQLVALWQAGRFPFDRLIRSYRFSDINEAAADAEHGRTIKPVLVFE